MAKEFNPILVIPIGLPGSGKTHYSKEFKASHLKRSWGASAVDYIDGDEYMGKGIKSIEKMLDDFYDSHYYRDVNNYILIDGPWFTEEQVKNLIEEANLYFLCEYKNVKIKEIILVYFNEDREACANNDRLRNREKNSLITIKNQEYMQGISTTFVKDIKNIFSKPNDIVVNVDYQTVHKASPMEVFRSMPYRFSEDKKTLLGRDWSGGGSVGSCWGDPVEFGPDSPREFVELDELLEMIYPNVTYLQHKRIMRECCKTEETVECDYYGGSETKYHWECDIEKLNALINEFNNN